MSAVLDEPVKPRRPRPLYWLWLGCVTLFWCIAAVVTTLGLSMSMRGRLVGGTSINLFATAFLGTVMMMATGLLIATWKVRVVPGDLDDLVADHKKRGPSILSSLRSGGG